ncbi:MAG: hypothetical protein ACYTAN_18990, partial [Planctomycetota bacterium]
MTRGQNRILLRKLYLCPDLGDTTLGNMIEYVVQLENTIFRLLEELPTPADERVDSDEAGLREGRG